LSEEKLRRRRRSGRRADLGLWATWRMYNATWERFAERNGCP